MGRWEAWDQRGENTLGRTGRSLDRPWVERGHSHSKHGRQGPWEMARRGAPSKTGDGKGGWRLSHVPGPGCPEPEDSKQVIR